MSKIGYRFLMYLGILSGMALVLMVLWTLGRWLVPVILGPLPPWLPEDFLLSFGYYCLNEWLIWLPSLALSAVILTFSFGLKPDDLPHGEGAALIRFSILAISATVVFALVELLAQPWVDARLEDADFRLVQTHQLEQAYQSIKDRGASQQTSSDLEARLQLLKRLGTLRPHQGQKGGSERLDYDFELQILKARLELDEFFKLRALPGVAMPPEAATVEELLDQAERALGDANGDREYQANLWATQAYRRMMNATDQGTPVDNRQIERAKRVVDESWARIYEKTLASDERLKASYFFRKGKSLGDFQFHNYLEAYYGFLELHRENPRDAEVTKHWALSQQKVADQVLFQQDMEVLFAVPGSENLVFVNRDTPVEVVRIGKLLNTSQGVFVRGVEFLRTDDRGQVLLHWTAPYGRWTETGIDFRVWDKESPIPHFPSVLTETPGDEFNPEGLVDPPRFQPRVTVRDLELVNAKTPKPQSLGTMELLVHGRAIEALGYNSRLFQTEFVVRLAAPFGFFIAFLFLFVLAWRNRAHQQGRSWWFLFPLLPLVMGFLVQLVEWIGRLGVGGLLYFTTLEITSVLLGLGFLGTCILGMVLVHRAFHADQP